jgi:hypothetical protein
MSDDSTTNVRLWGFQWTAPTFGPPYLRTVHPRAKLIIFLTPYGWYVGIYSGATPSFLLLTIGHVLIAAAYSHDVTVSDRPADHYGE